MSELYLDDSPGAKKKLLIDKPCVPVVNSVYL